MEEVKTNNNIAYRCHYDVVWCPKYRRDVIRGAVEYRLKQIIGDVCTERAATIIELETMPDHVHLLVSVDPQYGIHRLVKQIKGRSSRLLREEFPHVRSRIPTLWTNSYFVATVGGATLDVVKQYVANQRNV
jgi:putative transposase